MPLESSPGPAGPVTAISAGLVTVVTAGLVKAVTAGPDHGGYGCLITVVTACHGDHGHTCPRHPVLSFDRMVNSQMVKSGPRYPAPNGPYGQTTIDQTVTRPKCQETDLSKGKWSKDQMTK